MSMTRRFFLRALGILGITAQLPEIKIEESKLKTVKFNKDGTIVNYDELMEGIPFIKTDRSVITVFGYWIRKTEVWVPQQTPVYCRVGIKIGYGKFLLKEELTLLTDHFAPACKFFIYTLDETPETVIVSIASHRAYKNSNNPETDKYIQQALNQK